jgi:hypothetical protein
MQNEPSFKPIQRLRYRAASFARKTCALAARRLIDESDMESPLSPPLNKKSLMKESLKTWQIAGTITPLPAYLNTLAGLGRTASVTKNPFMRLMLKRRRYKPIIKLGQHCLNPQKPVFSVSFCIFTP